MTDVATLEKLIRTGNVKPEGDPLHCLAVNGQ